MFDALAFWNEKRRKKLSKSVEDLQNSLLFAAISSPGSQHRSWLLTANAAPWTPVSCHDFQNGRLSAFILPELLMAFSLRHAKIAYAFQPSSCQNCWCPSAFILPQLLMPFSLHLAKIADALQPSADGFCLAKIVDGFHLAKIADGFQPCQNCWWPSSCQNCWWPLFQPFCPWWAAAFCQTHNVLSVCGMGVIFVSAKTVLWRIMS